MWVFAVKCILVILCFCTCLSICLSICPHIRTWKQLNNLLWCLIQEKFAQICRNISVWIKSEHRNWVHIVDLCIKTLCHSLLCSSYQTAWCLYPQDSKMKLHLYRNLKYWIKWQGTLYKRTKTCIYAYISNVTCLASQGENMWELSNINHKWPLEHSIQQTDYIHLLLFLRLM